MGRRSRPIKRARQACGRVRADEDTMHSTEKALWFIENRLSDEISLEDVARSVGVSSHYLARAFGAATGLSLMRYARGRRLSEAARALAAGAPDILEVALCAGYGSHEAFTRAFRRQFGLPPEALRANGLSANIQLVEPIRMDKTLLTDLDPPRFVDGEELLIAGIGARYTFETNQGIPAQWQRFGPHIGHVPSQCGPETFGLCVNGDDSGSFEYIAGVRVSEFSDLPEGLSSTRVPRRRYVVFTHKGHVSQLRRTHYTIWNKWVPESGVPIADAPSFERYGKEFNPVTGLGPIEVWMPVDT
jgi:AraC family transcriptional regulator